MADCVLRSMVLLVIFMLKDPVYSELNFTVLDNDLLYSFYNCTCTEVSCSSNNRQSSTTSTPLNTTNTPAPLNATNTPAPISYHCSCLNKTRECPDNTNTSSSNISTVWVHEIHNSTLGRCDISQSEPPCSINITISEWIIQVNNTNIVLSDIFSNQRKFINCTTAVVDLDLDSICYKTSTSNTTTQATTATGDTTTPATTTTTAAAATGTTGLIITVAIVGVNIVLGIGVCAFILCKRRQIAVNYRKQQKIINKFSQATGNAATITNNIHETRPSRQSTHSKENVDPDQTSLKTFVRSAITHASSIEEVDRHRTFPKTFV